MEHGPQLGRLIEDAGRYRDAVHVAVSSVTAVERLSPGQRVGFAEEGNAELVGTSEKAIGIVDPFLTQDVEPGERCWLLLDPNSITGLRHVWSHPAFQAAAAAAREKLQ